MPRITPIPAQVLRGRLPGSHLHMSLARQWDFFNMRVIWSWGGVPGTVCKEGGKLSVCVYQGSVGQGGGKIIEG